MRIAREGYRAMLSTFVLAAGCGEVAYEDFAVERAVLECEIRSGCDAQAPTCEGVVPVEALDDCHWFRPARAERCLDAMDAALVATSESAQTCPAWGAGENPLPECDEDEVTRRRRGVGCFMTRLTGSGRPVRERGMPLLAPIVDAGGIQVALAHPRSRSEHAAFRWLEITRYEHASIATFSHAAVELMSLGAPLALVRRCNEAALDEARHAEAALKIGIALYGRTLGIGPLPPVRVTPRSLRAVALDALLDGCWGEAAAAVVATVSAARAKPEIAGVLTTIAREETEHAALAWATVRWAVDSQPALLPVLTRALRQHGDARALRTRKGDPEPVCLRAFGLLTRSEIDAIERDVLDRLVAPVLHAMARAPHSECGALHA